MERRREVKRAASAAAATRRLRISSPNDPADAEVRMDETPLIEKLKKANLQTFSVSLATQIGSTPATWSERKRHGFSEAQILVERTNVGRNSAERPEVAPSEEEVVDEACLRRSHTPFGRSRSKEGAKEDEPVIHMFNIPRRARSSAYKISSLQRELERCPEGTSQKQAPNTYKQRSPSPNLFGKRQAGTKNRPSKEFKLMASTAQVSDQEVEVAEVLFCLSRSTPCIQSSKKVLKEEEFDSSSFQPVCSPASEHLQKSSGPSSDEPKSKRHHILSKQQETAVVATSETASRGGKEQSNNTQKASIGDLGRNMYLSGISHCNSQLCDVDYQEHSNKQLAKAEIMEKSWNCTPEQMCVQKCSAFPGPSTCKEDLSVLLSCKDGEHGILSIRNQDQPDDGAKSRVDMKCPSLKAITEDEGAHAMDDDKKRLSLSESSEIYLRNCGEKPFSNDNFGKGHNTLGPSVAGVLANTLIQVGSKHQFGSPKEEQMNLNHDDVKQKNDKISNLCKDQAAHPGCLPLTPTSTLASTGLHHVSVYGKMPASCSQKTVIVGSSLEQEQAVPALQHPHATAQHYAPRMRRCATHVYVAHYIQQRQRLLRHTFWQPACVSGATYKIRGLPSNLQGKDQRGGNDGFLSTLQVGHATLVESIGPSHKRAHH